jgi:hypothetical protein
VIGAALLWDVTKSEILEVEEKILEEEAKVSEEEEEVGGRIFSKIFL